MTHRGKRKADEEGKREEEGEATETTTGTGRQTAGEGERTENHTPPPLKRARDQCSEESGDHTAISSPPLSSSYPMGGEGEARRGDVRRTCPYLDTVNRAMLDFDFEKLCSICLVNQNVYACLVCGKYFQGRGQRSHAYIHSVEWDHRVFMNLETARVYCLPDGYEVADTSLEDIKYVLHPKFRADQIAKLDFNTAYSRGLDGSDYLPGFIGLNNIKETDFVNAVVQCLAHIPPLRNFFMDAASYKGRDSTLVSQFGQLMRKIWSSRNFKGQVSPHELLQAIGNASNKRFRIGRQSDPAEFIVWILNALHEGLGGTRRAGSSVVHNTFQGELRMVTEKAKKKVRPYENPEFERTSGHVNFLYLQLELPPAPLFKDEMEENVIPQVPLYTILQKFNGRTIHQLITGERRQYIITRPPKFLILQIKRFTRNNFFKEKNPTIVNFPVKNLELREYCDVPKGVATKYDLVGAVSHEGKPEGGIYKSFVVNRGDGEWFEMQDLFVQQTMPQFIPLTESCLLLYERKAAV